MRLRSLLFATCSLILLPAIAASATTALRNVHPQAATDSMPEARIVDAQALPQHTNLSSPASGRFAGLRPQNGLTDAQFAALKQQAASHRSAASSSAALRPAAAPIGLSPALGTNFDGINSNCSFVIPSDMGLAVNGTFVVQAVNDCFAVYNKAGALQAGFPKSLNALFNVAANDFNTGTFVTDPRAFFDAVANRFVIAALWEDLPNSTGYLMIATSKTADPRGLWNVVSRNAWGSGYCPDFPTVGGGRYGDQFTGAMAVGINLFTCDPNGFYNYVASRFLFLPKVPLYKGQTFTYWYYYDLGIDTVQAINMNDKNEESRAIFALSTFNIGYGGGECSTGCSGLVLWAFSNVIFQGYTFPPVVTYTTLPTSTYTLPPNASQPYTLNTIDTNDVRLSGSVPYAHGHMWAAITTDNGGGGPGILAWEVHAYLDDNGDGHCTGAFLNACPQLAGAAVDREMNYDVSPSGGYYSNAYFPSIYPDGAGNLTMVFNFSGYLTYAGTNFLSQRVTLAPQSTFHDGGGTLRSGLAAYPYGRWGDYTAATIDGTSVWFSGMYANSAGTWNTGIGKTGFSSSNQP